MWEMDVIGSITPKASNGHQFILVVVGYFTKWMEATSFANVTQIFVCKFIKKEVICRYGLPKKIILGNALNISNKIMIEFCAQFKIKHQNSTPYRLKMNGTAKVANKNIKKTIEKVINV